MGEGRLLVRQQQVLLPGCCWSSRAYFSSEGSSHSDLAWISAKGIAISRQGIASSAVQSSISENSQMSPPRHRYCSM